MTETEIKNKDAYFIIVRTSKEKIDFAALKYQTDNKIEPIIIYKNTLKLYLLWLSFTDSLFPFVKGVDFLLNCL